MGFVSVSLSFYHSLTHTDTHTHSQRFSAFSLLISLIPLPTHKTAKCFSWTHFSACSGLATSAPDPLTLSSNMSSLTGVQRVASQYNTDLEEENGIHKRNLKKTTKNWCWACSIRVWCSDSLVSFLSCLYRFEIEIEPLFATMALYDLREKKKVRKRCLTAFILSSWCCLKILLELMSWDLVCVWHVHLALTGQG